MEEELETSTMCMLVPKIIREEPVSNGQQIIQQIQSISISETMVNKMERPHFMLRIKHKVQSRISTCMQQKKVILKSNSSPSFLQMKKEALLGWYVELVNHQMILKRMNNSLFSICLTSRDTQVKTMNSSCMYLKKIKENRCAGVQLAPVNIHHQKLRRKTTTSFKK